MRQYQGRGALFRMSEISTSIDPDRSIHICISACSVIYERVRTGSCLTTSTSTMGERQQGFHGCMVCFGIPHPFAGCRVLYFIVHFVELPALHTKHDALRKSLIFQIPIESEAGSSWQIRAIHMAHPSYRHSALAGTAGYCRGYGGAVLGSLNSSSCSIAHGSSEIIYCWVAKSTHLEIPKHMCLWWSVKFTAVQVKHSTCCECFIIIEADAETHYERS